MVTVMCLFNSLIYMGLAADTFFFHPLKDTGFEVRGVAESNERSS